MGEGPTEKAFLNYLKVENAHGGSPECIIDRARKLGQTRAYDSILIVMDTDRPWPGARQRGKGFGRSKVFFVGTCPCIEGLLLSILGHTGFNPARRSSEDCRRALRDYDFPDDTRTDWRTYERLFPRERVDAKRRTVPALDAIISFLTVGSPEPGGSRRCEQ